jgi:2-oxoglutarate dehydrogenase E2 component (dihydrolipoamide succinyltransferase)
MPTDVLVPTLGESITEATIGQWLKAPGDTVALDEPIASLETDKVSVEVPSPIAGTLAEQLFKEGATVAVGAILARVGDGAAGSAEASSPAPEANTAPPAEATAPEAGNAESALRLSPAVRRAVLANQVDPSAIKGSGKDGRLTKDDVLGAAKSKGESAPAQAGAVVEARAPSSPAPTAPASAGSRTATGERREERVKMTRMRQTIAARLKDAQNTAALLTTFNDVDMSAVIDARARYKDLFEKKHGIRLGFMGFFVKAVALAAKDVPSVNARIEGDEIVYHDYLDVSVAGLGTQGPRRPGHPQRRCHVLCRDRKVDRGLWQEGQGRRAYRRGHEGRHLHHSRTAACSAACSRPRSSIPPQSAVLGMHRIEERPVAKDGQVVIRPMMYLALSYDHRLIDGREAVTFLVRIKEAIEDPTRLLIDL